MSQNPSNSVSHTSAPNIQDWTTPGSSANTSNYASQASLNHAGQDFRFSTANTLHDDASTKSKDNELNEGEEDTEEAWEPGTHDEEESPRSAPPQAEKKEGQSDLVEWDGPNDPDNPHNWPKSKKWSITLLTGFGTFVVSFASGVFSAVTDVTAAEFGVSSEVMILGVTLYVIGFACGPLVWGPCAEVYGRKLPLLIGFFGFAIFCIPVAVAQDLQTIFVCRFFSGAFGSAPLAIVSAMYVDFWDPVMRGVATSVYCGAVFAGPALGPLIGAFTVENTSLSWRWTMWFTLIMAFAFWIPAVFVLQETTAAILLQRRAAKLRLETGNWALHSKLDERPVTRKDLLQKYMMKPIMMIVLEPILLFITIYASFVYGILYLIFFAFPYSFGRDRGWSAGVASLPFIAILIGVFLASFLLATYNKTVYQRQHKKSGKIVPENRLPPMIAGSLVLIIGLFWFAWTSFPSISWVPQVISGVFIGCGIIMVFLPAIQYLVDTYLLSAPSAISANTFLRSFVAAAFPLFATKMYEKLGTQWATSLLAFTCLGLSPFPVLFYLYGKKIRSWSRYAFDLN